jgi:hypothetical protein
MFCLIVSSMFTCLALCPVVSQCLILFIIVSQCLIFIIIVSSFHVMYSLFGAQTFLAHNTCDFYGGEKCTSTGTVRNTYILIVTHETFKYYCSDRFAVR